MTRTRIKFCGLKTSADIQAAAAAGADAVGFVFHASSPRNVDAAQVASWLADLPPLLHTVFLFMNPEAGQVSTVLDRAQPSLLQFHGDESAAFCTGFGLPYIKALPMGRPERAQAMVREHARSALWLADSHGAKGSRGGSGQSFDWSLLGGLPGRGLVAGGLHAGNVGALIQAQRPWGVDVSSGIEDAPGLKSARKMQQFARAVRDADARHAPNTESTDDEN